MSKKARGEQKKMKKEEIKGITLISLIVTIIILLILAGIGINLAIGEGGIFELTKRAGEEYEISQEKENIELIIIEAQMEKAANNQPTPKLEEDILPKLYEKQAIISDYGVEKEENGKETVNVVTRYRTHNKNNQKRRWKL